LYLADVRYDDRFALPAQSDQGPLALFPAAP